MTSLKRLLPRPVKDTIKRALSALDWDPWQQTSWSQEGEDLILSRIFEQQDSGFYVDIGAHHPKRFSNTYMFYRKGWHGINVDAMPGSMQAFNKHRPRDVNLELGVGCKEGELEYYLFSDPALNGFSKELSERRHASEGSHRIRNTVSVKVSPLSSVLAEHLPIGTAVDFMTIDVEGLDLEVLQSNDWQRFRPRVVLAEALGSSVDKLTHSEVGAFMERVDYVVIAMSANTVFFKDRRSG